MTVFSLRRAGTALVRLFCLSCAPALAARVDEPDVVVLRRIHALKGVCLNLGFAHAGAQAVRLERALRGTAVSPEQLPDALRAYIVVLDEALDAAARHLAAGAAS
jgi:HPt (histidine-containing phosphotransfer) domain-containing protein